MHIIYDLRNLKSAARFYYDKNQAWPTEADVDKLDQYCDKPIVRANPRIYAAVMIKNGCIGVRLLPEYANLLVQEELASRAKASAIWANADGRTVYKSGLNVWIRMNDK
jgi:hypothetical protein